MKKKIVVAVSILFVIIASWLLFSYFKEYNNNVHMQIGKDTFEYEFIEAFSGNEWDLYVNEYYVYSISPFEGCSEKEMERHLSNVQKIKCFYDKENIRIYGLPLEQYKSKYEIIYTVNGLEFHSLKEDVKKYKEDLAIEQRLDQLYEKYPKEELKKREQESWE